MPAALNRRVDPPSSSAICHWLIRGFPNIPACRFCPATATRRRP